MVAKLSRMFVRSLVALISVSAIATAAVKKCEVYDYDKGEYELKSTENIDVDTVGDVGYEILSSLAGFPESGGGFSQLSDIPARECDRVTIAVEVTSGDEYWNMAGSTIQSMSGNGSEAENISFVGLDGLGRGGELIGFVSKNFGFFDATRIWVDWKSEDGKNLKIFGGESVNWRDFILKKLKSACNDSNGIAPVVIDNAPAFLTRGTLMFGEATEGVTKDDLNVSENDFSDGILLPPSDICSRDDHEKLQWIDGITTHGLGGEDGWPTGGDQDTGPTMLKNAGFLMQYPYKYQNEIPRIAMSWFSSYMSELEIPYAKVYTDDFMKIDTKKWKKGRWRKKVYVKKTIDIKTGSYDIFPLSFIYPYQEYMAAMDWASSNLTPVSLVDPFPSMSSDLFFASPVRHPIRYVAKMGNEEIGNYHDSVTKKKSAGFNWLIAILVFIIVVAISVYGFGIAFPYTGADFIFTGYGLGASGMGLAAGGSAVFATAGTWIMGAIAGAILGYYAGLPHLHVSVNDFRAKLMQSSEIVVKEIETSGSGRIGRMFAGPAVLNQSKRVYVMSPDEFRTVTEAHSEEIRDKAWDDKYGTYANYVLYNNRKVKSMTFWGPERHRLIEELGIAGSWGATGDNVWFDGQAAVSTAMSALFGDPEDSASMGSSAFGTTAPYEADTNTTDETTTATTP